MFVRPGRIATAGPSGTPALARALYPIQPSAIPGLFVVTVALKISLEDICGATSTDIFARESPQLSIDFDVPPVALHAAKESTNEDAATEALLRGCLRMISLGERVLVIVRL